MSQITIAGFTTNGCVLAQKIVSELEGARAWAPHRISEEVGLPGFDSVGAWAGEAFAHGYDGIVFVGACGIAVRAIAPYVASKMHDPAVVCVDEAGTWAISLLSGHVGGANDLARRIARIVGGTPVVTTATDVRDVFAIDEWAARQGLVIANPQLIKHVAGALLEGGHVGVRVGRQVYVDGTLPAGFVREECAGDTSSASDTNDTGDIRKPCPAGAAPDSADASHVLHAHVHIGPELPCASDPDTLHLITRNAVVGVGCRRGCEPATLQDCVEAALVGLGLAPESVCALATIDLKAAEPAVVELAAKHSWLLRTFSAQALAAQSGDFASSEFVRAHVGVDNVCERALACCGATRILDKQAHQGTTVAVGLVPEVLSFDMKGGNGHA